MSNFSKYDSSFWVRQAQREPTRLAAYIMLAQRANRYYAFAGDSSAQAQSFEIPEVRKLGFGYAREWRTLAQRMEREALRYLP